MLQQAGTGSLGGIGQVGKECKRGVGPCITLSWDAWWGKLKICGSGLVGRPAQATLWCLLQTDHVTEVDEDFRQLKEALRFQALALMEGFIYGDMCLQGLIQQFLKEISEVHWWQIPSTDIQGADAGKYFDCIFYLKPRKVWLGMWRTGAALVAVTMNFLMEFRVLRGGNKASCRAATLDCWRTNLEDTYGI